VDFKDYVKNVLPNEWIASWSTDALKAGAMAVKTYAWYRVLNPKNSQYKKKGFDVRDDTCDQVYKPNSAVPKTSQAVDETWDWVMTRNGKIFEAQYVSGTPGSPEPCVVKGRKKKCYPGRMSQWGTQYWAEQGKDWQWILHYYYDPINLSKANRNLFKEDFEGDVSGWTFTSFWHVQDNPQLVTNAYQGGCVTLPDDAHLPSATSGSKALWYGQATDGSFVGPNPDTASPGCTSSQANSGTALSPMVDLTTASAASLKFQSWFEIESVDADRFDLMKIEILNVVSDEVLGCYLLNPPEDVNGPDNQPFTSGGFNSPAQWVQQSVDLTPFIGQKVRFRFTFDTRDRLYNGFRGWLIDDVVVSNQTAPTSSTLRACPLLGSASSDPRGLSGKDTIKNPSFNLSIKFGTVQFMADGQGIQEIQVQVFNLAGREVYNSGFVTGSKLYWNGLTNDGRRLANGVYLYVIIYRREDGTILRSEVKKLVILR
jgi:hypothetical protein